MLKTISSTTRCPPAGGRGPYPQRGLHLIDIENLAGSAAPSPAQIRDVQRRYTRRLSVSAPDQERYAKPAASAGLLGLRERSVQVARAATAAGSLHNATFT